MSIIPKSVFVILLLSFPQMHKVTKTFQLLGALLSAEKDNVALGLLVSSLMLCSSDFSVH